MDRSLLHVGCGGGRLPDWLTGFNEIRLDIDDTYNPDIVADMKDMGDIGQFDVVFCQHALEHLYPHEVTQALEEFRRVLKDGGSVMVFVPDLEDVRPTEEIILESPAGPITGLDMFYGYRPALADNPHMAHKTGFIGHTLSEALANAGFRKSYTRRLGNYNLMGIGVK